MTNKYQEALYTVADWFHSYKDKSGVCVHEKHIDDNYRRAFDVLQELVDKYGAMHENMIEDAKFLKEVVEPHWGEIKKSFPVKILQATNKDGNFVGDTIIELDYEKALDKMASLLTNAEKDSCYYCPLSRSGESLDEIKKKCIAKGGVICMKEDWKEWAFRDEQ